MNRISILSIVTILTLSTTHGMVPVKAGAKAKPVCHPCTPFAKKDIAIARSRSFYASLDPRDLRVPRVFLQTHEHVASLKEWTPELWQEFGRFEKSLETALNKTFKTDLVNVACLMNLAGEEGTHTHWHFIPRLATPITITHEETGEQHLFEDPCYGKPYDMNGKNYRSTSPAMMMAIIKEIQKNLDISNLPEGALKKN